MNMLKIIFSGKLGPIIALICNCNSPYRCGGVMGKYAAGGELKPPTTGEGSTMYIPPQVNLER